MQCLLNNSHALSTLKMGWVQASVSEKLGIFATNGVPYDHYGK